VREQWAKDRPGNAGEILRRQLQDLVRKEERLAADLARVVRRARREEITLAEQRAFQQDIARERQEIQELRSTLEQALAQQEGARGESEALMAWVAGANRWESLHPDTQKDVLRHMVDHLVIYKPKGRGQVIELDVYWRG
ncbi:MAG TPA: hypothetical protein VD902_03470, partial [Symbiobacteriaceae bacterium]|nr:hypothetical protein [Symbiobacteriaceae bacterium]